MLLAADIGNTHTVLGVFRDQDLEKKWRLRTDPERTTDEWGLILKSLFELKGFSLTDVTHVAISSVVPQATFSLTRASQRYFDTEPLVVGPGVKTGLAILLDSPREVGADRVVNAVAAYAAQKRACIVVDLGTATTFDCISEKGEYLGGAISPGGSLKTRPV